LQRACQSAAVPTPKALTVPMPVMTTERGMGEVRGAGVGER
jgi:hypothetical protein